jgi:hypothetical protein
MGEEEQGIQFKAVLWKYQGKGALYFLTLPVDLALIVRAWSMDGGLFGRSGFRPIKVRAQIEGQEFQTALFFDKSSKSYLLPVKKSVRTELGVSEGQECLANINPLY